MSKTIRQLYKDELTKRGIPTKISRWYTGRQKCFTKEYVTQDGVELERRLYSEYTNAHNKRFPSDRNKKVEELIVRCRGYIDESLALEIADNIVKTYHKSNTKVYVYVF